MIHDRENNEETESFLMQNGKKFSQDCITAMKLMYSGVRLNGDTCKQLYGFSDRRLRDCIAARPDIVRKEWKRNSEGKRLYVEYYIPPTITPTKAKAIEMGQSILDAMNAKANGVQQNLF